MSAIIRAAILSAALALGACDTEIVLTENRHPGELEIRTVDAAGACVLGVSMDITAPGGTVQRGTNAYSCPFYTVGKPGEWKVEITPPGGYALAPGQESVVRYKLARDEKTILPVRLVRSGP